MNSIPDTRISAIELQAKLDAELKEKAENLYWELFWLIEKNCQRSVDECPLSFVCMQMYAGRVCNAIKKEKDL